MDDRTHSVHGGKPVPQDDPDRTRTQSGPAGSAGHARPEAIGRYRILGRLGEGGMGVVYEAEQQSPRRRVALKVIRGGAFVDEARVRMFQREVETLARLEHPNIGGIYESGRTEEGEHFFAMELVAGPTLDRFLTGRGDVDSSAEMRFRLSLFRTIADAVHYAHQRGVIHRDLKPSNIVVTGETGGTLPEVKILDFGLARMTDGDVAVTKVTEVGVIKGTLPYMSPEQARGDPSEIDLRSDVYALGVILHEMIAGRRPYDLSGRSLVEAIRIICDEPAVPVAKTLSGARRIDTDLRTIAGKALEKDPDRRYASAAALSEDVGRYLGRQPILARPPTATYQLRKFAARNKALVGGVVATFVVLVAGIVVATWLGLQEAAQRREAEAARNDLQAVVGFQSGMLRDVDARLMGERLGQDLARRLAEAAASTDLADADAAAEIAAFEASLGRVNLTDAALRVLDEDVLDRAARTLEERFADRPLIEARLRASLSDTYRQLGLQEPAERHMLRARELYVRERGPDSEEALAALLNLSWIHERQGRLPEAEAAATEALQASRRLYGADHTLTLFGLTRLGIAYDLQERFDDALGIYEEAYATRRRQAGDDDVQTIWFLHNIGSLHRRADRSEAAEPMLEEAVERFSRVLGEEHPDSLWAKESLVLCWWALGRLDEAEGLARAVLDARRRVLGEEHLKTVSMRTALGGILTPHRLEEAEELLKGAIADLRALVGENHYETLWAQRLLAECLVHRGKDEEAEALFKAVLETWDRLNASGGLEAKFAREALAGLYERTGRKREAAELRARARS